jgi:hypothetical protein
VGRWFVSCSVNQAPYAASTLMGYEHELGAARCVRAQLREIYLSLARVLGFALLCRLTLTSDVVSSAKRFAARHGGSGQFGRTYQRN